IQNIYFDNACQLLFNPAKLHGVIICGNEHGDILSDGAAESVGSLGLMCSSAINPNTGQAMFESGAGTAPTLAGQNKANPIGRILTAALILRHIGAPKGVNAIENAVKKTLQECFLTADLVPAGDEAFCKSITLGTAEMGEKILSNFS
ncbi:isocitrate/isopropylmalate family dehydrogenase, partial [Candidatus Parcubacteria bacterium]|nr:isocitrate/isopropylmalate family dehydrogenase [Candidatus Parcubacteria bacterium]